MVLLQVKWKDYEDQSDITWEPERVLRCDFLWITSLLFPYWSLVLGEFSNIIFTAGMMSPLSSTHSSKSLAADVQC